MIIAVDGPAGSGKSTVSKLVARKLGLTYIDTGAMYRAVTYEFLNHPERDLDHILSHIHIQFEHLIDEEGEDHGQKTLVNGKDISREIRSIAVTESVSEISAIKEVRDKLVSMQRKMSEHDDVILDGRDIGTVVFPNANLKIYLVASPEIRAQRRLHDLEELKEDIDLSKLVTQIKSRDHKDSTRKESPLTMANDAIEINTDELTIDEVVDKICQLAGSKKA